MQQVFPASAGTGFVEVMAWASGASVVVAWSTMSAKRRFPP